MSLHVKTGAGASRDRAGGYVGQAGRLGRGALAGPVVAAAVILDPDRPIMGLADSKLLSARQRAALANEIREKACAWAVAGGNVAEIDAVNILQATLRAMRRAVEALPLAPQEILVDGLHCPDVACATRAVVHGCEALQIFTKSAGQWRARVLARVLDTAEEERVVAAPVGALDAGHEMRERPVDQRRVAHEVEARLGHALARSPGEAVR